MPQVRLTGMVLVWELVVMGAVVGSGTCLPCSWHWATTMMHAASELTSMGAGAGPHDSWFQGGVSFDVAWQWVQEGAYLALPVLLLALLDMNVERGPTSHLDGEKKLIS